MSKYSTGENKGKSKKPFIKRNRSPKTVTEYDEAVSPFPNIYTNENIPSACRQKLAELFVQIEKEFEKVYLEKHALQEKVHLLTEKIESSGNVENSEKLGEGMVNDGVGATKTSFPKKTSAGKLMSRKLKTTYKASTNKFVSSFKPAGQTHSIECHYFQTYDGHKDGIWDLSTSKHIPTLLGTASADHNARLWCIDSGHCHLKYTGHHGSVNSIQFHPSDPIVSTGSGDGTAHIWRLPSAIIDVITKNKGSPSESSPDWSHDENDVSDDDEGVYDSADGHRPFILKSPATSLKAHTGAVMAVDWLPDGKRVVTASWDNTAKLWDAERSTVIQTLTGHDDELTHTCSHRSQDLIVTASHDSTFRLWDFRTPSLHSVSVFQGHASTVTSAVFTDQDVVISGSDDRTVKVVCIVRSKYCCNSSRQPSRQSS
ncbi:WD repeat-containing protein 37-like isoform X2 [Xenia sp. Carnegie-2017]|uniref:WD repeat-containing protein 37-like isoform X2 n=1 Tax=Xenia sp. Carnegie-2017 TaxID=2897299 RepID=UPI001F038E8F|nr:WD repeat-containing protein 37-like isoform X2 [Xenia sp. Carnegie-2017]